MFRNFSNYMQFVMIKRKTSAWQIAFERTNKYVLLLLQIMGENSHKTNPITEKMGFPIPSHLCSRTMYFAELFGPQITMIFGEASSFPKCYGAKAPSSCLSGALSTEDPNLISACKQKSKRKASLCCAELITWETFWCLGMPVHQQYTCISKTEFSTSSQAFGAMKFVPPSGWLFIAH